MQRGPLLTLPRSVAAARARPACPRAAAASPASVAARSETSPPFSCPDGAGSCPSPTAGSLTRTAFQGLGNVAQQTTGGPRHRRGSAPRLLPISSAASGSCPRALAPGRRSSRNLKDQKIYRTTRTAHFPGRQRNSAVVIDRVIDRRGCRRESGVSARAIWEIRCGALELTYAPGEQNKRSEPSEPVALGPLQSASGPDRPRPRTAPRPPHEQERSAHDGQGCMPRTHAQLYEQPLVGRSRHEMA